MLCFEGIAQALAIFQGKREIPKYKLCHPEKLETLTIKPEVLPNERCSTDEGRLKQFDPMPRQRFFEESNSLKEDTNLSFLCKINYTPILLETELLPLLARTICLKSKDLLRMRLLNQKTSNSFLSTKRRK
jgi:hypothetical protein